MLLTLFKGKVTLLNSNTALTVTYKLIFYVL